MNVAAWETWLLALFLGSSGSAAELAILPPAIVLTGPEARQPLVIEQLRAGQFAGQITNGVEIISSDPSVVLIENGTAIPVKNGHATLRARAGKQSASAPVTVQLMEQPFDWSFRNHVQPVLARNGCSAVSSFRCGDMTTKAIS
jgi:hypothetical protein